MRTKAAGIMLALLASAGIVGCQSMLAAGDMAPDFTAATDKGELFSLGELRGKSAAVLYFYPKGETPGYVTEAGKFRAKLKEFERQGKAIVGVSYPGIESPRRFEAEDDLRITLVSDPQGQIAEKYGVPLTIKEFGGERAYLVNRTAFLIDKDGRIEQRLQVKEPRRWRQVLRHFH